MANSSFKIMSAILILSLMVPNTMATEYVVGGSGGWDLGVNLNLWLGLKVFHVGDILHFNFIAPHTVAVVSATAYLACDATNVLPDVTGALSVVLSHTGVFAFISTGPNDCLAGLKLLVAVL